MPIYEYRCNDTGKRFEIAYKTYAEYDAAVPRSPFTGSTNVTRVIRRVALARSSSIQLDRIEAGDMNALAELEHADPQTLGRVMRHLGGKLEDDLGPEFNEVVERLESGQTPEAIEAAMPDIGGSDFNSVSSGGIADSSANETTISPMSTSSLLDE